MRKKIKQAIIKFISVFLFVFIVSWMAFLKATVWPPVINTVQSSRTLLAKEGKAHITIIISKHHDKTQKFTVSELINTSKR